MKPQMVMAPTTLQIRKPSPFKRAFFLAGATLGIAAILMTLYLTERPSYRLGQLFVPSLFAALVVSLWSRPAKEPWTWRRTIFVYLIAWSAIGLLGFGGTLTSVTSAARPKAPTEFIDSKGLLDPPPAWVREFLAGPERPFQKGDEGLFAILKPATPPAVSESWIRQMAVDAAVFFSAGEEDPERIRRKAAKLRFIDMRNSSALARFLRLRAFAWQVCVRDHAYAIYHNRKIYFLRDADASVILHEIMHWLKDTGFIRSDLPVNYAVQGYASDGRLPGGPGEKDGLAPLREAVREAEYWVEEIIRRPANPAAQPAERDMQLALALSVLESRMSGAYRANFLTIQKKLGLKFEDESVFTAATGLFESVAVRKMEAAISKDGFAGGRFAAAFFFLRAQVFQNHDQLYMDSRANHDKLQFIYLISAALAMRPDLTPTVENLKRFIGSYPSISGEDAERLASLVRHAYRAFGSAAL